MIARGKIPSTRVEPRYLDYGGEAITVNLPHSWW